MKILLAALLLIIFAPQLSAQFTYKVKADSVRITNEACSAELILENNTKDTLGFLYNYGKGRTEFRRVLKKIDSKTYLLGADTLKAGDANRLGVAGEDVFSTDHRRHDLNGKRMTIEGGTLAIGTGTAIPDTLLVVRRVSLPLLSVLNSTYTVHAHNFRSGNFLAANFGETSVVGGKFRITTGAFIEPYQHAATIRRSWPGGSQRIGLLLDNDTINNNFFPFPDSVSYKPLSINFRSIAGGNVSREKFYVNGRGEIWSTGIRHATANTDSIMVVQNGMLRFRTSAELGISGTGASISLPAGSATSGTAPLKFSPGTNLSIAENGAVEFDGTNYFVTTDAIRHTLAKTLTTTASLNFASTAALSSSTLTISLAGAASGDVILLGIPSSSVVTNGSFTAWVSSPGTVSVQFSNNHSATSSDPAEGVFRVSILKY